MRYFSRVCLAATVVLQASWAVAKTDIPEWDIARLKEEAKKQGWTFKVKESWVTEHLRGGGSIDEITGLKVPENWKSLADWDDIVPRQDLPATYDWRTVAANGLQPIRNQRSCGSCWAFSVTAVLEALLKIQFPEQEVDLAEQTLVSSCCSAGSCGGGYFTAFNYLVNPGLPDETQDPYLAQNSRCKADLQPAAKIVRWAYLGSQNRSASVEQIKTAVMEYGPVSVDINASFGSYGGGVYNRCNSSGTNHMVNIEGWNDEEQTWIMRNSWGSDWGEAGYMRIKWKGNNGNRCNNIGRTAAYAVFEPEFLIDMARKHGR